MSHFRASLLVMGYRRLLKRYMGHVNTLLGTPLVSGAAASQAFSKRDLGELSAMAAELSREALLERDKQLKENKDDIAVKPTLNYRELIELTIAELKLTRSDVAELSAAKESSFYLWCQDSSGESSGESSEETPTPPDLSPTEFTQALALLITAAAKRQDAQSSATQESAAADAK